MSEVVDYTERFALKSKLADAGIPMGATVTWIMRARWWRSMDARNGLGYARRFRIRRRKQFRASFVYEHRPLLHSPHTITLGRTGGRVA